MSMAQQAHELILAAGQFNDGTKSNFFGNLIASGMEILAVVSLGIGGWQVVQVQAKSGAQNQKIRDITMIAAITLVIAGFIFFLPQWMGLGQGLFSGFFR